MICCHSKFSECMSSKCKLVDQPGLLTILTNQIWHLAQWWTGVASRWPESYNTDKSGIWLLQTCGSTSLMENTIISNLKLGTVIKWDQLRLILTLKHRQRSNLMVWKYKWKTVLAESVISQIISCGRSNRFPRKDLSKSTWFVSIAHFLIALVVHVIFWETR